jgi:hypothetical protein
MRERMTI